MKATTVKKILSKLSEDCMEVNERRNKKGVALISYQLTIKTSNREYRYDIDEDSNWNVEDGILWLEDNEGTRWIDLDKKASDDESRAADIIKNWIRNRATIEFLGAWEMMYNPNFKVVEFDHFRKSAGLPTFTMNVTNWVEDTSAIGIYSKAGRYGGTYAHKDIAFEFGAA